MMAGKAKSCYLSVMDKETRRTVLSRMFFKMEDLHKFVATEEFKEKYPAEKFTITREIY
jgi:hypothetical protein